MYKWIYSVGRIFYDSTRFVFLHTLIANLYISLSIQAILLPFMNNIQVGVIQQDNTRLQYSDNTQHA